MNITIGGTTKTYTYSTSDQLEAAYKINIDGTYTEAVAKLKFYYLGGSSTFSPKDGYGCVNSKQTEIRPVPLISSAGPPSKSTPCRTPRRTC